MPEEIAYDPNQMVSVKYQDGDRNYQIDTCQESLRRIHDRVMEHQVTRDFAITRDGVTHSSRAGTFRVAEDADPAGGQGESPARPPEDAVTPPLGSSDEGIPTGIEDDIREAIEEAIGKARKELQELLAGGFQITIEETESGGIDIKAQSLNTGTPSGDEDDPKTQVRVLPDAGVAVKSEHVVLEPDASGPRRSVTVAVGQTPTDDGTATSTQVSSAKAEADGAGVIAVNTALAVNIPLLTVQVTKE